MKVTGLSEVPTDSRDIVAEILANGFEDKVKAVIRRTSSIQQMGIKQIKIESVTCFGTQYYESTPVGHFWVTIKIPAKRYEPNRAVYLVYITGGDKMVSNAAYFEETKYVK
jgi:hypothetical protein